MSSSMGAQIAVRCIDGCIEPVLGARSLENFMVPQGPSESTARHDLSIVVPFALAPGVLVNRDRRATQAARHRAQTREQAW